jgi:hypothetical protein
LVAVSEVPVEDVTPVDSPTSSISSIVSSATETTSTAATSVTATPEKTEEEKKKEEEEEEKKRKEKEAQSARCSKANYQEIDGETPYAPFCNPRDGQDWTADQNGFYQSKFLLSAPFPSLLLLEKKPLADELAL